MKIINFYNEKSKKTMRKNQLKILRNRLLDSAKELSKIIESIERVEIKQRAKRKTAKTAKNHLQDSKEDSNL